jgi:hypothetical protein
MRERHGQDAVLQIDQYKGSLTNINLKRDDVLLLFSKCLAAIFNPRDDNANGVVRLLCGCPNLLSFAPGLTSTVTVTSVALT